MLDITKIPLDDPAVWDLICDGHVKGVFQIESRLGKAWCRRMKPRNIEELSDLTSAIRPGTLQSKEDGKSMTQHYSDRKSGVDEVKSLHPSIDDIVRSTQGIILFQEQSIQIAVKMAGFSEEEGEDLRKAIGKKNAELMTSIKVDFINGCIKNGHSKEDAERIFGIIEKSSRYSFNKSHSVEYSIMTYWSAYLKLYYPKLFYLNWLKEAHEKPETDIEVRELIMSAKVDGIEIFGPRMEHVEEKFSIQQDGIYFGMSNIKHVGKSDCDKLLELLKEEESRDYAVFLLNVILKLNKRSAENMIAVGVFTSLGQSRTKISHDLDCIRGLSKGEIPWLQENAQPIPLTDNLLLLAKTKKEGGGCHTEKRVDIVKEVIVRIENPGRSMLDSPDVYVKKEINLLGVPITYSRMQSCADADLANCTCREYNDGKGGSLIVACEISSYREHEAVSGTMCFATVEDETGEIENVVVFPDCYSEYEGIIYDGATILLCGKRSDKGNKDSFIVEKVMQI